MGSAAPPFSAITVPDHGSLPQTNGIRREEHPMPVPRRERPTILHLGDPIRHNPRIHRRLQDQFEIKLITGADLERSAFINHLIARTWGDFSAIMRPFWRSGNEMSPWDRELIELLPKSVKVMASAGAGFDWVDEKCLAENGIIYCNGARASNESVADMALYHIISVFRHMTASSLAARSCSAANWKSAHNYIPAMSHNPRNHTLGIVGLGNIGFAIAVKVKAALGMKIIYQDIARKIYDQDDHIDAEYFDKLEDMLPVCDCVLIATPGGPPLLTAQTLSLLPRGARVVNIARGSLVDENALADALDSGHIDAAGLDVFANEPHVNERLAAMSNVEMTCHTGGGSVETNMDFERLSMENCEAVLNGYDPSTPVNMQWLKPKPLSSETATPGPGEQNCDRPGEVRPAGRAGANTVDTPVSGPAGLPAINTHVGPMSTQTMNEEHASLVQAQVDSAVSMSMDEGHAMLPQARVDRAIPVPVDEGHGGPPPLQDQLHNAPLAPNRSM